MKPSERAEEFPDWVKIPIPLQHEFFELAKTEAERRKALLLEQKAKLERLRALLPFNEIPDNDEWKDWRVAVVDGSDSPVLSERVGGRFGAYAAGYHIFEDNDLVEEGYRGGHFSDTQTGDPEKTKKLLDLLATCLEREVAVECLKKDVDLILIDGAFFGFRPRARIVADKELQDDRFRRGSELTAHIRDRTLELLKSGKVVGVIKRVQTAAIDGWTIYRDGNRDQTLNTNDKEILASLMRRGEWFSYEEVFDAHDGFYYLSRLAWAFERYTMRGMRNVASIYEACREDVKRGIKLDLDCAPTSILQTKRSFVRCGYPSPPFAFETPIKFSLEPLLAYFQAVHNPATGLPMPIDLMDQDISLPRGFTREFVEEIEANLVQDKDLDSFELESHFASLNPQKQE